METRSLIDEAPPGSELATWETDGTRRDYSNVTTWVDPDEQYRLELTYDDPVQDFLVRLFRTADSRDGDRIAQTIEPDSGAALATAVRLAAAAPELDEVDDRPSIGPNYVDLEPVEHPEMTPTPPEEWAGHADEWAAALEDAVKEIGEYPGRPSLLTKEIDGNEYYYLQYRSEGEVVTQYVAPVEP